MSGQVFLLAVGTVLGHAWTGALIITVGTDLDIPGQVPLLALLGLVLGHTWTGAIIRTVSRHIWSGALFSTIGKFMGYS